MTEWMAVITITLLAVISPGPDFAMVSRNALSLSRRAGLLTALGIGIGVLLHVSYAILGVGFLLAHTPMLFRALQWLGAAYLIWLGVRMLRRPSAGPLERSATAQSDWEAFRTGFLTNSLNPKTAIFIISLFMQVVSAETSLLLRVGYGAFIALAHILWFSMISLFFGSAALRQRLVAARRWMDYLFGMALIGFGISLAIANMGG